jgi:glycine oxidase
MSDFLVIGGGIIGLLTARELADAGAVVTLLDKGETGSESSWAGGGIISPLYPWRYQEAVTRLAAWSQQHYPRLCDQLLEQTGVDAEFTRNGLLILDTDEAEAARAWADARGYRLEVIDGKQVRALEPGLGPEPERALWLADVGQVRNPRLVRAARQAIASSVRIVERSEVLELRIHSDRASGVRTPDGILAAERIVVCAGAWTAELFAQLGKKPQITPVRGQMILFYAKPGDIRRIVLHQDRYVIPRRDGRVLMGSTLEHAGFDKNTTRQAREELYLRSMDMFPALHRAVIENHWAGLRPASPSGIPYIGAYPGIDGLYFNAGHFRNGVVMGPASARLMADIALGREPIVPPEPYTLDALRA